MNAKVKSTYGHVTPLKVYLVVGAALLLLTAVTVKVSQIPLGSWNVIVALGIAAIKGLLVILFFMHLYYDRKVYLLIFATAIMTLTLFIVLTGADTMRRGDIYPEEARPIQPEAQMYQKMSQDSSGQNSRADSTGAKKDTVH